MEGGEKVGHSFKVLGWYQQGGDKADYLKGKIKFYALGISEH